MATYGKLRETRILGQAGTTWHVQLWKKDYTGDPISMDLEGEGFTCKYTGSGGTRDRRFINSECVLNFIVQNDTDEALLYDILEKGDREYYIRVYKNSISRDNIWWFGWVHPSFSTFQNTPYPYGSSIIATDSVGTYSKQAESAIPSAEFSSSFTINEHIKDFGDDAGLYNVETDEVENGSFLVDTTGWSFGSRWSLDSGLGKINFTGSTANYLNSSSGGISVTSGEDISISFTIQDLGENESFSLSFRNQGLQFLLGTSQSTYQFYSNGNYVIKGTSLVSANQLRINPTPISGSINFSLTDISLVKTLVTDSAPCPTNNYWFQNSINWWRNGDAYNSDDPFYLYRIAKLPFVINPEKFPDRYLKYDVLNESLKVFNTVGTLSEGRYKFIQPNFYKNNLNGNIKYYEYQEGNNRQTNLLQSNELLTLDGTLNSNKGVCMGGSTFTYEPPYKSVQAKFENGSANIIINPNVDYTNYTFVGNIQADPNAPPSAHLNVSINLFRQERLIQSMINAALPSGAQLKQRYFLSVFDWQIRITDGTSTKYLTHSLTSNRYQWVDVEPTNRIAVGYNGQYFPNSDPNLYSIFNTSDSDQYPCRMYFDSSTTDAQGNPGTRWAQTKFSFGRQADLPPITGQVFVKLTANDNYYWSWKDQGGSSPDQGLILPLIFPVSPVAQRDTLFYTSQDGNFTSITDIDSISINDEGEGIVYNATQSNVIAEESFQFEDLLIGSSGASSAQVKNIQYLNSDGVAESANTGFRVGNSGGYINPTQLLCNQYLDLQAEPLEILQADVFSPDISPTKLIQYSINNNTDFNYYTFLGGTFKAQSETMSGEWFKANSSSVTFTEDDSSVPALGPSLPDINNSSIGNIILSDNNLKSVNALGTINADITSNSPIGKLETSSNILGRVYDNQKLIITSQNNNRTLVVVVNGEQAKGSNGININSITPEYPIPEGSTISILEGDLTNVKAENVLDVRTAHYHHSSALSTYYIPISGASTAEGSLSSSAYHLMFTAPYDGFVKSIHNYNSHNSSKFSFITFHKAGSTTVIGDTIQTPFYTNNFEEDCPTNWTFNKGDVISFGRTDSSQVHGVSMSIVLQYNTQPPAQPQP